MSWRNLVSYWDCSVVNPTDRGWRGFANDGTGTGLVAATDVVGGVAGGLATEYDGAAEKTSMGDVGTIRTVALWIKLATTTEEIFKTAAGRDVMANAGTITYTGVAATATYVDGVAGVAVVAGRWHHLVCVFNADEAASSFELATDGVNFGALVIDEVRVYDVVLTPLQVRDRYEAERQGRA